MCILSVGGRGERRDWIVSDGVVEDLSAGVLSLVLGGELFPSM